jgi:hypothetical protein
MAIIKGKSDGGSGGKRGHSNMDHWMHTDEIKTAAKKARRLEAKERIAAETEELVPNPDLRNDHRLRINLNRPTNGWLEVELMCGDQLYGFVPSHVPYDSVGELANALLGTLDGYEKTIVHWNDEPVEHEFVFALSNNRLDFRVNKINETIQGKVMEQVFSFCGSIYDVTWPFWKALREMESRLSKEEYERQWREPFPSREMAELGNRIRKLRQNKQEKMR